LPIASSSSDEFSTWFFNAKSRACLPTNIVRPKFPIGCESAFLQTFKNGLAWQCTCSDIIQTQSTLLAIPMLVTGRTQGNRGRVCLAPQVCRMQCYRAPTIPAQQKDSRSAPDWKQSSLVSRNCAQFTYAGRLVGIPGKDFDQQARCQCLCHVLVPVVGLEDGCCRGVAVASTLYEFSKGSRRGFEDRSRYLVIFTSSWAIIQGSPSVNTNLNVVAVDNAQERKDLEQIDLLLEMIAKSQEAPRGC
jgi:hypothetical protein